MRTVQLAEHFAQQFLEIVIIVDARQETTIGIAVAFPVDSVDVFHIELVLHLLPSMVEDVLAFFGRFVIEDCFKVYSLTFAVLDGYFLDTSTATHVEMFPFLVGYHHTIADSFHDKLGTVFFQVLTPEVGTFFERCLVIELVAFLCQYGITQ